MADESIGVVKVDIVGDYSGLESSFQASQDLAQQAGQQIGAALESGAAGATNLTDAVTATTAAITDAAAPASDLDARYQALFDQGMSLSEAMSAIATQDAEVTQGMESAAVATQQAAGSVEGLQSALGGAAESGAAAATGVGEFGHAAEEVDTRVRAADFALGSFTTQLLSIAGITISAAAIKEFATDALEAFSTLERGTIALTALTGSSQAAAESIASLRQVAVSEGLDFPQLLAADQRLTAFGVDAAKIPALLIAAADAAGATGNSFDRVANSIERMALSGMAGSRQLVQLGLSTTDLARTMETTSAGVAAAFKGLEIDQRVDVLIESLHKFEGVGIQVAQSLSGQWQTFKTQMEFAMAEIGASIAPIAQAFIQLGTAAIPAITDLAKTLGSIVQAGVGAAQAVGTLKQSFADMIPPGVGEFLNMFWVLSADIKTRVGLLIPELEAAKISMTTFALAVETVTGKGPAFTAMTTQITNNLHNMTVAATTGGAEFKSAWNASLDAIGQGKISGVIQGIIDTQQKLTQAVTDAKSAYDKLNTSYQTQTALGNGHVATLGEVQRALANVTAAEAAAATTKTIHTANTKALTAAHLGYKDAIAVLVAMEGQETAAHKAVIDATAKWNEATGQLITGQKYLQNQVDAAKRSMAEFYGGARDIFGVLEGISLGPLPNFLAHAEKIAPLMDQVAASITAAAQAAIDTSPYAKLEQALDALGIKGQQYYKDLADKADAAYQVVLNSGVATYQELAQAALTAAAAEIRAALEVGDITRDEADKTLKQIQDDLGKLDTASAGSAQTRGRHERTLGEDVQAINKKTFDSIERGLANSIVNLKGFGDLWKTLWQGLAKDLLNIMFKTLLDPLEKAVGKVLGGIFGGGASAAGSAAGGAASAGGGAASTAGSAAGAASSLVGIIGAVGSVGTMISSIVGNFQSAKQETTLNAIEVSTRYLMIGLVTQGDSLLNDSHVIRNSFTDFNKWNQNVAQAYYQQFAEKLDTLIGFGGMHPAMTQEVAKMSMSAAEKSPSNAASGGDVIVNIDTVASDVTDTKVRDTMNRAVRMSKLAGAFPPNRFPS